MNAAERIKLNAMIKQLYRTGCTDVSAVIKSGRVVLEWVSRWGTPSWWELKTKDGEDLDSWSAELKDLIAELTPAVPAPTQAKANRQLISSRDRLIPGLRELLDYNPETGVLTWRIKPGIKVDAGDVAGCPVGRSGNLQVQVRGYRYMAHELAWALHYGAFATSRVHHRNGSSNAINNLYVGKKS